MDGGNTAAGEQGDRAPIPISEPGILRSVLVTWQGNSVAERLKTLGLLLIQQHKQRDQLHAYIDESGNTGANLFDPKQPHFFTVAMSSPTDFDVEFREDVERIARDLGVRYLHANEIGLKRVEKIAMDVVDVIERSQVRFHHVLVSKPDSAMFQFFYALFDPGENQAASSTAYWCRVLRFEMVVQLASIMELDDVRMFWDAMRAIRSEESEVKAMRAIDNVLRRVDELNDARVRELMGDTFKVGTRKPRRIFVLGFEEKRPLQTFAKSLRIVAIVRSDFSGCRRMETSSEEDSPRSTGSVRSKTARLAFDVS